jgi:hypothetical protein
MPGEGFSDTGGTETVLGTLEILRGDGRFGKTAETDGDENRTWSVHAGG